MAAEMLQLSEATAVICLSRSGTKKVLLRGSTASVKALCTKCRDEADHRECIECNERKHKDDFGRTKREIHSICTECEGKKPKFSKAGSSTDAPASIFCTTPQDHTGFSFGSTQEAPSMSTKKTVKEVVEEMNEITEEIKELTLATGTYSCSVCTHDVSKDQLYWDGRNMQWKSNDNNRGRTHFWCLSCAFPTCNACHTKASSAIMRDAAEFVDIKTRDWYQYQFFNSKKLRPTRRSTER